MNVRSRSLSPGPRVSIMLGASAGTLSRIMMRTNVVRHGGVKFANSCEAIGRRRLGTINGVGILRDLGALSPSFMITSSVSVKSSPGAVSEVAVHNNAAVAVSKVCSSAAAGPGRPLFVLSNFRSDLRRVGSLSVGEVRSVALLGSTTSATVCNSGKTGNIIIMRAVGPGTNRIVVGCDKSTRIT